MKLIRIITLSLLVSCSAAHSMQLHDLRWSEIRDLVVRNKGIIATLATLVWLEKCPYNDNHLTYSSALDGYKHINPFKQTFNIVKDVVIGASHRYIHHPRLQIGYKPGYGLLGSTWSGIKHTTEALHDIRRVKDDIEYWLNYLRNLRYRS